MNIKKLSQDRALNAGVAQSRISKKIDEIIENLNNQEISSSSKTIASGEFNLKDVGTNVLLWVGTNTAANTAPTGVIVELTENDTYVPYSVPIEASTSFTITDIGLEGDTMTFESLTDGLSPLVYTKSLFETNPTEVAAEIVNILELNVEGVLVTALGAVVTLTFSSGGAANNEVELPITIVGDIAYSGGADFSGGTDVTDFSLKLNGEIIKDENLYGFMTSISQLTLNNLFSQGMLNTSIFSNSGNWALPVTEGTQDDFRIKISILGERID